MILGDSPPSLMSVSGSVKWKVNGAASEANLRDGYLLAFICPRPFSFGGGLPAVTLAESERCA